MTHPPAHPRLALALAVALTGGVVALAQPAEADAISKARADAMAQRVLASQIKGDAILFGLGRRLGAGEAVGVATRRVEIPRRVPLGQRRWLYWLDLAPYAQFEHRSVMLLVDDRTGRVVQRRTLRYYPMLNGRIVPWLRSPAAYEAPRYRVTSSFAASSGTEPTAAAATARTPHAVGNIPAIDLRFDCILFIGGVYDEHRRRDFRAMQRFADQAGIRSFYATGRPGGGESTRALPAPTRKRPGRHRLPRDSDDIRLNLTKLAGLGDPCLDILIYGNADSDAFGLRMSAPRPAPTLALGSPWVLTPEAMRSAMTAANEKTTYKLKIDANLSGRWVQAFRPENNAGGASPSLLRRVLVAEASGAAYRYIGDEQIRSDVLRELPISTPAAVVEQEVQRRLTEHRAANPDQLSEFTNANIRGMTDYASSDAAKQPPTVGNSRLASMLAAGAELGKKYNESVKLGLASPVTLKRKIEVRAPGLPRSG